VSDPGLGTSNSLSTPEVLLLVKRIGIDKTWQVAPYPAMSRERTERLADWLRRSLPGCPMETRIVEL
jgi:hypothetical protein